MTYCSATLRPSKQENRWIIPHTLLDISWNICSTPLVHPIREIAQVCVSKKVVRALDPRILARVGVYAVRIVPEVRWPVTPLSNANGKLAQSGAHLIHSRVEPGSVQSAVPATKLRNAFFKTGRMRTWQRRESDIFIRIEEVKRRGFIGVVVACEEAFREVGDLCLFNGGWKSNGAGSALHGKGCK